MTGKQQNEKQNTQEQKSEQGGGGRILGIDLGTTNSVMAVSEGGKARILENAEGDRVTPSVVAYSQKGEILAGQMAKRQASTNPQNTIYSSKRLVGRDYDDASAQKDKENLPFEMRKSDKGGVELQMGDKWYRPAEISARVLQKLKQDAEDRLGGKVDRAVITVPAYFDDSQRKATKDAGTIAGFEVERILNEPTAAALAYGLDKQAEEQIVVYDFGGGTFDVSVLEVGDDTVEVKATGGDTHLGGDDFDQAIIDWLINQYKEDSGVDLSDDKLAFQRLKEAAEKAKIELSSKTETTVNIPFVTSDESGPKHLEIDLSRSQLEKLVDEHVDRSIQKTREVLKEAGISEKEVDEVVLVGGQTKMPLIQKRLEEVLGKKPHKDINPDEVVAIGAATQAGVLQGDVQDILLLDVTPLTLGIETLGGVMTPIIEKNTTIPAQQSQVFSTAADNQTSVEVHVLQGEREMAADNKSLGRFVLDGIPPSPRGTPQIEVTFDIDANGILHVTAKEQKTGKEQSIRIEATSDLTDEEVEKMRSEAEKHAEEDKRKKELAEARNNADSLLYTARKTLEDNQEQISDQQKQEVEEKIKQVEQVTGEEDPDKIKNATQELSSALSEIGNQIYQSDSQQSGDSSQASSKEEGNGGEEQNSQQSSENESGK